MSENLNLRGTDSPFTGIYQDTNKGSVLTHTELDQNFITLKGHIVYDATIDVNTITLKKLNGQDLTIDLVIPDTVTSITGLTFNPSNYDLTMGKSDGTSYTQSLSILATDMTVTGGTFDTNTGIVTFTNNSGGTFTVSGFLTGMTDTYWTSGSTGNYSIKALNDSGLDATGDYAVAEGNGTRAFGDYGAHAEGNGTLASGNYGSHAEGGSTTASGNYGSHAEGYITTASGNYGSHAEGYQTTASSLSSHSEGEGTIASGQRSHAEGWLTTASSLSSHAEGQQTIASGENSHAEGSQTTASGNNSHAEGDRNVASGNQSHAEGQFTVASGVSSHAEGSNTISEGSYSHAEGDHSTAVGNWSHAEGNHTTTYGDKSHAEGNWTIATGENSHAEGLETVAGWKGFSIDSVVDGLITLNSSYGNVTSEFITNNTIILDDKLYGVDTITFSSTTNTQILLDDITVNSGTYIADIDKLNSQYADNYLGNSTHAEGSATKALGDNSHAEGIYSIALGSNSHAEGYGTFARGDFSHAEGGATNALGFNSHAEGNSTLASGDYSHAEGSLTTASGIISHAEGYTTTASGAYSHAEGMYTTASGSTSHVEGRQTLASGENSHAEGYYSLAQGDGSHAEGGWNDNGDILYGGKALGKASHAEGQETIAGWKGFSVDSTISGIITLNSSYGDVTAEFTGNKVILDNEIYNFSTVTFSSTTNTEIILIDVTVNGGTYVADLTNLNSQYADILDVFGRNTHAEGNNTKSLGVDSHAEGYYTMSTGAYGSHAEGNNTTANAWSSHAEGERTTASGMRSHAEGELTTASGPRSHTEGYLTVGQGINSHAEGQGARSLSNASHAEGAYTTAVGNYSHSEGYITIASGETAHAEGFLTTASGDYSHSEGGYTTASGSNSHAEGKYTTAIGSQSHSEGNLTIASGNTSHAEGYGATAGGDYSHAEGKYTTASGYISRAEGWLTTASGFVSSASGHYSTASGYAAHAEGKGTTASGYHSHAEGRDTTASGYNSHTEGYLTTATGSASHAEGNSTIASGSYSHAEGGYTTASGDYSSASGGYSIASGDYSHAEGYYNNASGSYSHVEGASTTASGNASHAEGYATLAFGNLSHAEGDHTIASGTTSHAGGYYSTARGNNSFIHSYNSLVSGNFSVVLGGQNITGTSNNTVYVPYLNIKSATTNNNLTDILVLDTNGDVKKRTISTIDTYATGFTFNPSNYDLIINQNNGQSDLSVNLGLLSSDMTVTGGTYNSVTGIATFTNNTGGTFTVSGFLTGMTDTYVSGFTYGNNTLTIKQTAGKPDLSVNIDTLTGLTINGNLTVTGQTTTNSLSASTISATTITADNYENLPFTDNQTIDWFVSGSTTYVRLKDVVSAPSGGTRTFQGDVLVNNGLTANTISATTYYNLPATVDTYVSGFTYGNNTLTIKQTADKPDLSVNIDTLTGLTINGNLTATTISNVDYIDFNKTAVVSHQEGRIHWNDSIKSLEIDTENSGVQLKVGHDLVVRVNNQTASTILKGSAVYINGEQGQRPTITLANYSGESTSAGTLGLAMGDINPSSNGYVITQGILEGVNTLAYSAGTPLYLYTGGTLTSTKPQAPNHDVRIGKVIVSNATTGSIYVNIQNGYELNEIHDVRITSATTGDLLVRSTYNGSDVWVNSKTLNGDYMFNGVLSATTISATTITATDYIDLPFTDNQTIESFVSGSTMYVRLKDVVSAPSGGTRTFQGNVLVNNGLTANTISATTYQNLPLDIYTTGGTYNSGTGIATFTNNSGGSFTVSGFTSGGSSFTGGTVSGPTDFTGGLTANTISATTYQNLPKVGFSPINVGVCDTAPTAASTQYYYQTIGEVTTTLSKVKLWGFSGSDLVIFGLYRGSLSGSMILIGQAIGTCGLGPNELTLTAETGQNLSIVAGEDLVVGYYPDGTSWRTVYDVGISDISFGITNATNITTMPATPTGTATGIRFACTLY